MGKVNKPQDFFGIAPYGESLNTLTKGVVDGAGAFLGRICLPVAEEFGLLLRDRVAIMRTRNKIKLLTEARILYERNGYHDYIAQPRLVAAVLEHGSWSDEDIVQRIWSGLLVSSCSKDGSDDSNLIFINLVSQLTSLQIKILNFSCEHSKKFITPGGWIAGERVFVTSEQLKEITETTDLHRIDRELDSMRESGLITGGFNPYSSDADISPTALALNLYVRAQGSKENPLVFFGIQESKNIATSPTAKARGFF